MNKGMIDIQIKEVGIDRINAVDARELHKALGVKEYFPHWVKRYINKFVVNQDYIVFVVDHKNPKGGRPPKDYAFSLDMAKHAAMMSNTEKSYEERQYFIECETQLRNNYQLPNFEDPAEAAMAWAEQYKQRAQLEHKVEEDKPKVQFYEDVGNVNGLTNMTVAAQELGWGRNKLFGKLRLMGIFQQGKTIPYTRFCDQGYFVVK